MDEQQESSHGPTLKMDPDEVRAWKARWDVVAEIEREERRRSTPASRFRELVQLMASGRRLGFDRHQNDAETLAIAARWQRLREANW